MPAAYVRDTGKVVGDNVNSLNATFATTPSVGNFCVATLSAMGVDFATISDNQSNTYALDAFEAPFGNAQVGVYSAQIATASGTFTVTFADLFALDASAMAIEFSGVVTSAALDKTATNVQSSTADLSIGPTATLSQANELIVSVLAVNDGGNPIGYPSTYTGLWKEDDGTYCLGGAAYKIVSSTTAVSAAWTNVAANCCGVIATYKATAGGDTFLGQACL